MSAAKRAKRKFPCFEADNIARTPNKNLTPDALEAKATMLENDANVAAAEQALKHFKKTPTDYWWATIESFQRKLDEANESRDAARLKINEEFEGKSWKVTARDKFFSAVCNDWPSWSSLVTGVEGDVDLETVWPVEPVTEDQSWWDARAGELLDYVREHKRTMLHSSEYLKAVPADVFNGRVAAIISHMNACHGLQLMQFHWLICCDNNITRKNGITAVNWDDGIIIRKGKKEVLKDIELVFDCEETGIGISFALLGHKRHPAVFSVVVHESGLDEAEVHKIDFKVTADQYAQLRQIKDAVPTDDDGSADNVDDADTFKRFIGFVKDNGLTLEGSEVKRPDFADQVVSRFCNAGYFFAIADASVLRASFVDKCLPTYGNCCPVLADLSTVGSQQNMVYQHPTKHAPAMSQHCIPCALYTAHGGQQSLQNVPGMATMIARSNNNHSICNSIL